MAVFLLCSFSTAVITVVALATLTVTLFVLAAVCSFPTAVITVVALATLTVTLFVLAAGNYGGSTNLIHVGGYL